jgi:hypothetical protein
MAKLNKERIAMNLLTCPTIKEAAEKSGISEPTLYRLRKNTEFQAILQIVKSEIFNDAIQKAQGYCIESLEVLRTIMNDSAATDSSRVSAARTVLELGLHVYEQENIIQKLDELERRLLDD